MNYHLRRLQSSNEAFLIKNMLWRFLDHIRLFQQAAEREASQPFEHVPAADALRRRRLLEAPERLHGVAVDAAARVAASPPGVHRKLCQQRQRDERSELALNRLVR